jgi:hypothetical protein
LAQSACGAYARFLVFFGGTGLIGKARKGRLPLGPSISERVKWAENGNAR